MDQSEITKKSFFHFWSTPGCFGGLRPRYTLVLSNFSRVLRNLTHPSPHTAPVDFEKLRKAPFGQVFGDISKPTESIRDEGQGKFLSLGAKTRGNIVHIEGISLHPL